MKIITVWDIMVWDGGDRHIHKYFVDSKAAADEWKKNNPFDHIQANEIVVFDSLVDIDQYETGVVRKRAMSKLTDEEKFALGVKD